MISDDLPLEFVRVVERAAIAAARTMGQGDRKYADQVAVEAMRKEMESVDIEGTIVIGEGERDEAPMLFIGEKVGTGGGTPVDIAVDPLEGTNLAPMGPQPIAVSPPREGGLLNAPDIYMEKLVVGPPEGQGDINARGRTEGHRGALDRRSTTLIIVLDRPRHERLIADIRKAGAHPPHQRRRPLGRHLRGGLGTGVHAVMAGGAGGRARGRDALPER
jgi:fructose-1,6-bisphosphatase/sedoheptulose 1,7-bisphosphatase-like protein